LKLSILLENMPSKCFNNLAPSLTREGETRFREGAKPPLFKDSPPAKRGEGDCGEGN
jgi:hypothetical protein